MHDALHQWSHRVWIGGINQFAGNATWEPFQAALVTVDRDHGHAFVGKLEGGSAPELAGGADHDRNAVGRQFSICHTAHRAHAGIAWGSKLFWKIWQPSSRSPRPRKCFGAQ